MFEHFSIPAQSFYELIIQPAFADLAPAGTPFNGELGEFTVMDDVPFRRSIVDIKGVQNILQRRDASCDIIYKKVLGTSSRVITVEEVYGATQLCRNEFYKNCLKDWRNSDPVFGNKILPFFLKAIYADITSNAYFGDVNRVTLVTDTWSTGIFDGIFKWIKTYITAGIIPAGQTLAIADGTDFNATPATAYALIKSMYAAQSVLMRSWAPTQKAFYVSQEIAQGYDDYLIAAGVAAGTVRVVVNGIERLSYKGIPILVENTWTPIITQIKGSAGYAGVLTIRGNWIFATDAEYGEGADGKTALQVWYDEKDMRWYYRMFLKAGTQIALPEHTVVALSSFT